MATYTTVGGEEKRREIRSMNNVGEYDVEGSLSYITPSDCNDLGVVLNMVVRNEHGLSYTDEVTLVKSVMKAQFSHWEDAITPSVNSNIRNFVVVGQRIRYYVNVSAEADPSSVVINGVSATRSGYFNGSEVSNTTWYVEWSKSEKGVYDMSVEVTVNGRSKSESLQPITVYGLVFDNRTTTVDTSGDTLYMIQNASYTSTYLTAENTTLAANIASNYYNLFVFENQKIKSVAREQYFVGTNGSVSFDNTGTDYSVSKSGNNIRITATVSSGWYNQTVYLRQTNEYTVQISNSTNQRNWYLWVIRYDMP